MIQGQEKAVDEYRIVFHTLSTKLGQLYILDVTLETRFPFHVYILTPCQRCCGKVMISVVSLCDNYP